MSDADQRDRGGVEAFFVAYAAALAEGDLDAIGGCYGYPSQVVSDDTSIAIDEPAAVKAAFSGAAGQYRSRGLVEVVPGIGAIEPIGRALALVDVRWSYRDTTGTERQSGSYRYLLRSRDGQHTITTVISLPPDAE